ncbi:hypothetical protein JMA_12440 [Jeotgalibacillus malaysiensis]|uniref:Uncharacterized protein n=1 Tax=Jeotgalibacillus malaysiensis TaxID=1508404 RepID=A0A0B5AKK3_9BACL|nr:hypothetical protein [Jeotgalibacillus malaysiensis]AJD90561.1 hypothetical protein JMA_12440 [Jeotgalibacillus malaysiensis]
MAQPAGSPPGHGKRPPEASIICHSPLNYLNNKSKVPDPIRFRYFLINYLF